MILTLLSKMKTFIFSLFLIFPLFLKSQILTNNEIIKKRDSLNIIVQNLNNINLININQLDSLNKILFTEKRKRILNTQYIYFIEYKIKEKRNNILYVNKLINNNIRLIRKYPLPTSATPKSKPN